MRYMTYIDNSETINWDTINWRKVIYEVNRLQRRIAKSVIEKKWRRVKSLQHIITNSFYAKLLAVRRIVTNKGSKTAGVDNIIWKTPKQYVEAVKTLKFRGYKPKPLRRIYIKKKNGKKRPLSIPTLIDRAMQALFKIALEPISETLADPNSYGFRVNRSCADAIGQAFLVLAKNYHAKWIVEADIKACFDKISHEFILENIPIRKDILKKWLDAGYLEDDKRFAMQSGTPQGGIISPTIMNMVLDGLETEIRSKFPRRKKEKVNFIRYADDFIITAKDKETAQRIVQVVRSFLNIRDLELSKEKTKITHIDDGVTFLSQNIRKYKGKLLIKPSKEAIKSIKTSIREIFRKYRGKPAHLLIAKLNPVIRGWANYHKMIVSKETFYKVGNYIYDEIWRWIKYNHPTKGKRWAWKRYFSNGIFSDIDKVSNKKILLFRISSVKILRHIKIKGACNPFNPLWDEYLTTRERIKKQSNLKNKQNTLILLGNNEKEITLG